MMHRDLGPMARGYVAAMVESQEFWPDDFETAFDMFKLAEVDHFLPGAHKSIEDDCRRFVEMVAEEVGTPTVSKWLTDDERYRIGNRLWYRRIGSDRSFQTGDDALDRAMNAAVQHLGRPKVGHCSIGYVQHRTQVRK